jgi:hypothetical protein
MVGTDARDIFMFYVRRNHLNFYRYLQTQKAASHDIPSYHFNYRKVGKKRFHLNQKCCVPSVIKNSHD